jgi:PAS domain-containing protein
LVPRPSGTHLVSKGFKWTEVRDRVRAIPTLEEARAWEDKDRAAITGINNLIVFDWDSLDDRLKFWDKKLASEILKETLVVQSRRGFAEWFFDNDAKKAAEEALGYVPERIDVRPDFQFEIFIAGHLASVPGNLHPDRKTVYKVASSTTRILRKDGIVKQVLERLVNSFHWKPRNGVGRASSVEELVRLRNGVRKGERHNASFRYAVHLLYCLKFDFETVLCELKRWNEKNSPPLAAKELESQLLSAVNWVERRKRIDDRRRRTTTKRQQQSSPDQKRGEAC